MINYLTVTCARFTQRVENISYVCLDMSNIKVSALLSGLVLFYVTIIGKYNLTKPSKHKHAHTLILINPFCDQYQCTNLIGAPQ